MLKKDEEGYWVVQTMNGNYLSFDPVPYTYDSVWVAQDIEDTEKLGIYKYDGIPMTYAIRDIHSNYLSIVNDVLQTTEEQGDHEQW
jgi:hypothetical protein